MAVIDEKYGQYEMPSMEAFNDENMTTLYRVAFSNDVPSIFKYGYSREFTGGKGGNMYGPGVYCTVRLADTIENVKTKPEYGNCIIKMRLIGGFDRFIIFDERKARETYGPSWRVWDQVLYLTGSHDFAEKVKNFMSRPDVTHHRTAPAAYLVWREYREKLWQKYKIRGFIYKGNRDGFCALPFDFSAVIPYAVSYDYGKSFITKFSQEQYDRMQKTIDAEFRYKGEFKEVLTPVNGFCAVSKGRDEWNLIDISNDELVSPVWFEIILGNVDDDGDFSFSYDDITFRANVHDKMVYNRGHAWFPLSELPQKVTEIKERRAQRVPRKLEENTIINDFKRLLGC